MTDEQIKQNAEEYYDKLDSITIEVENEPNSIVDTFIAGAHSRDEEIKRLYNSLEHFRSIINNLRNPWISVKDRLPEEEQDVLICNWVGRITRNECISKGDINHMKNNPELYTYWMAVSKPQIEKGE